MDNARAIGGIGLLAVLLLVMPATASSCAASGETQAEAAAVEQPKTGALPTPFTAEQIRDAFRPGLEIRFYSGAPDGTRVLSRLSVLEADEQGVLIEQATLDDTGKDVGEVKTERSSWTALRDHAAFPAETTSRAAQRRPTPLGEFNGWLYTVRDRDANTVVQYFFANVLPGPPVTMVVRSADDRTVLREYLQVTRTAPDGAAQ